MVLRPGLSGSSMMVLGASESIPGMNGAGISESMCVRSTSSSAELFAAASCSQVNNEPRSFPGFFGIGLRDGGLPFGRGDRYERFARVGKSLDRVGVVGSSLSAFFRGTLIRGMAGVGAEGDVADPSMNSTSMVSRLSSSLGGVDGLSRETDTLSELLAVVS